MKIKFKKILVFILTVFVVLSLNGKIFATSTFEDVIDNFKGENDPDGSNLVKEVIQTVLTLVRIFAAGLSLIVITVMGTKYVTAAATEKAEIKGKLINFVIGIVLVVAATSIIDIVVGVSTQLTVE